MSPTAGEAAASSADSESGSTTGSGQVTDATASEGPSAADTGMTDTLLADSFPAGGLSEDQQISNNIVPKHQTAREVAAVASVKGVRCHDQ